MAIAEFQIKRIINSNILNPFQEKDIQNILSKTEFEKYFTVKCGYFEELHYA